jgi:hypothetical protein
MNSTAATRATVLGLDLDNTVALYDDLFHDVAVRRGLVGSEVPPTKIAVRAALRACSDGERAWQEVQAEVYGPRMHDAQPSAGIHALVASCHRQGAQLYIISHRSRLAHRDATGTDLREAACAWLRTVGLVGSHTGLRPEHVVFTDTRRGKLARIGALGCTHFVDDLLEVLTEPGFPPGVVRLLYGQTGEELPEGVAAAADWGAVERMVFGG